jgi:hypothetical protein
MNVYNVEGRRNYRGMNSPFVQSESIEVEEKECLKYCQFAKGG